MIKLNSVIIFIILLHHVPGFLSEEAVLYKEGTLCISPDFSGGSCTSLSKCPSVLDRYSHGDYFQRAHKNCGSISINDSPLVCCSKSRKPAVDKTALENAERCRNSASQIGLCIPQYTCEDLYKEKNLRLPIHIDRCDETEVCCIFPPEYSFQFPTMEDGCGEIFIKTRTKRIVGGETSKIGNWPWIALIGYRAKNETYLHCAGALISKRHVLTAAHCLRSTLEFVRLGEHDLTTSEESEHLDIPVEEFFPHPEYDALDSLYDIGILLLYNDTVFTNFISPICLPSASDDENISITNKNAFVAGWGRTMEKGSGATILQNIEIQIHDNSICKELYIGQNALKSEKQFSDAVICTGDLVNGKDSCKGDSGGPLMLPVPYGDGKRFILIGLVSYGIGCGRKDVLSVNTNIVKVMPWIKEQISKLHRL